MMRVCKECGREFELAPGEIKFYKSKNLALPKRCKDCRDKNKAASHNTGSPDNSYSNNTCNTDITGTGFNVNNTYTVLPASSLEPVIITIQVLKAGLLLQQQLLYYLLQQ